MLVKRFETKSFDEAGNVIDEALVARIENLLDRTVALAAKINPLPK